MPPAYPGAPSVGPLPVHCRVDGIIDRRRGVGGEDLVSELAKGQEKLGGGYLSAFPTDLFDRLKRRERVWAPSTYHKIMAGMIDMNQLCGNPRALEFAKRMADWVET